MNIGYGVSVWSKSTYPGACFDGISVYTEALWRALNAISVEEKNKYKPYTFIQARQSLACGPVNAFPSSFYTHLGRSMMLKHKLSVPLDLFHATDHYIPRLDVPVIATVMDLIPFLYPEWTSRRLRRLKNWAFKRTIFSADHLITISNHSKQDLMRYFSIPEHKISVTPLGVDECYFYRLSGAEKDNVLLRHQLYPGFFLCVGTVQPRKNIETVLQAHALCSPSFRKRYPVVIVGQYGWNSEALLEHIKQLESQGYVRWLRQVSKSELCALLQSASALMFLSKYEGFGLPVLEGFASECPVVASNTTSIPEVAGDAALLVSPDAVDEIKALMVQLIEDASLVERCRQKGVLRAQTFSWAACAQATREAYSHCLTS